METNFKSYLSKAGLSEAVIAVLEEEVVVTFVIFQSLREEHFERLLPRLKAGQHALLLKMWESMSREVGLLIAVAARSSS